MKTLCICSVVSLVLFVSITIRAEDAKLSQRFGDSVITLLGVEEGTEVSGSDHHHVAVRLRAENIGKRALCIEFKATLKATFGLEYIGTYYTPKPFKIRELLPSEKTEGEYMFSVKNGSQRSERDYTAGHGSSSSLTYCCGYWRGFSLALEIIAQRARER
jgi:hypothetical protein